MNIEIKNLIWKLIKEQGESIVEKYPEYFSFNTNSEYIFMQKIDDYTDMVRSQFMKEDVVDLDRHKVAAIIICSIVEAGVLKVNYEYNKDNLFDGNEKIAVNIGLSYMKATLKKMLEGINDEGKFDDFFFPQALTCETSYETILCRNLYFAKQYFILNPIDIANILFLLENISLAKYKIDIEELKKKSKEIN